VEKRYKFRIYPTQAQEAQIQKNFGCCRFVYNYFLAKQIERRKLSKENSEYAGLHDTTKELPRLKRTAGYEWLSEADSASLSYALCDLDNAFKKFFKNVKRAQAPGFPKFKSKKWQLKSYRCKNRPGRKADHHSSIEVGKNQVKLPKLGWIKCAVSRAVEGRILSASVIQQPNGKYFVSVYCTDVNHSALHKTNMVTGLHLGVKNLVTTSDGEQFANDRYLKKSQAKINRLRRQLSRKPSDSKRREKARKRLADAFDKVSCQRTDALHKLTTKLVRQYDVICVRESQVSEMMRNRVFSKHLSDANLGEIIRQLSYKCQWYGKTLVKVNKLSPSVQICSGCGYKNTLLKPHHQEWNCPECGLCHKRGINAAVNVLNEGLRLLESNNVIDCRE
jgi:putative transposase